jgi:hypothetical protein
VSDDYIRLIPTQVTWEPTESAAESAMSYVAGLFSGVNGSADEVTTKFYADVALIDSGVNTSTAKCRSCGNSVDLEWVFEVVDERVADLSHLDVIVPCCEAMTSLNDLEYDWPMGFARFEIAVLNGSREVHELQAHELERVGSLLGHPVRQVLAHY